ncbi:MAG: GNAT family N-acetyltransferase [Gammaproteobacteria bacterium]
MKPPATGTPGKAAGDSSDLRDYQARERLADDTTLLIRAILPEDGPTLAAAFRRLSPRSVRQRFFDVRKELTPRDIAFFTELDFDKHVGLAGLVDDGDGAVPVATARYIREPDSLRAEMAFVVGDDHQGRGIGTLMFRHLAGIARRRGIACFEADVLPDNDAMLGVFRRSGYPWRKAARDDVLHVEVDLNPAEKTAPDG